MAYKVLSLKWRPTSFDQVIGQEHITISLSNAIKLNRTKFKQQLTTKLEDVDKHISDKYKVI